jgi:Fe-S cluster assembly protein SufD
MEVLAHWSRLFAATESLLPGAGVSWLRELRREAAGLFAERGFPTRRDEDWRYAALDRLHETAFEPTGGGALARGSERLILDYLLGPAEFPRFVFVNGAFAPEVSRREPLPAGVEGRPLAAQLAEAPDLVRGRLGRLRPGAASPLASLATAFLGDGFVLRVPRGTTLDVPVHLVFLSSPESRPAFTCPRVVVVLEPGSRATLIESFLGSPGGSYFTCAVAEMEVGEGAALDHVRLQEEGPEAVHAGEIAYLLERDGQVSSHVVNLGAASSRVSLHARLAGPGSAVSLDGLFVAQGRQVMDHHTVVEHATPHARSSELYKGVLDHEAEGGFTGRVVVHPGAVRTDATQTSRNLLLSEQAAVNARPQLEIYADDVACSHGATSGQLDPDALFYMRTRGLPGPEARILLTRAFADEMIDRIRVESLRAHLHGRIDGRVAQPFREKARI